MEQLSYKRKKVVDDGSKDAIAANTNLERGGDPRLSNSRKGRRPLARIEKKENLLTPPQKRKKISLNMGRRGGDLNLC